MTAEVTAIRLQKTREGFLFSLRSHTSSLALWKRLIKVTGEEISSRSAIMCATTGVMMRMKTDHVPCGFEEFPSCVERDLEDKGKINHNLIKIFNEGVSEYRNSADYSVKMIEWQRLRKTHHQNWRTTS